MAKKVIADERPCGCTSGPQFYRFTDVDERKRCTTCLGLDESEKPQGPIPDAVDA